MSLPSTLQSMLEDKYEELLAEGLTPEEAKDALLPNGQVPNRLLNDVLFRFCLLEGEEFREWTRNKRTN